MLSESSPLSDEESSEASVSSDFSASSDEDSPELSESSAVPLSDFFFPLAGRSFLPSLWKRLSRG